MHEISHCYCILCTKIFLPYSVLNDNEFKQTVIGKQVKLTHIAKPAISNTENFIKAINSENNFTKYFTIKDLNSAFNDISSPFSLFHLNINSLSFHYDELESLISKSKNNFQIIGISETRLAKTQETATNIHLKNYNIEHVPTESSNGGVVLYIKKAINYKLRPDLMIYKKRELESVFIEIIQKDSKNIEVGCIYRHPCMQQSEFIDEYLKPLSEKLISENKEVILLGDFNIDLLKCDSNKNVSNFLDIIYCTNLLPNIISPTRLTSRSQTLIDNIFSSVINDDCIAGNLISPISDHHAQFLIILNYTTQNLKKDICKRNFKHFSSKKFITDLEKVNWDDILNVFEGNVNKSFQNFSNKITDILDKHVPITKLSLKEMKSSNKPWLTKGILKSINQKKCYL